MKRFIFPILIFVLLINPSVVGAESPNADPKTKVVTVSASVPDNIPPTTPVLISPTNNSYLTTGYPTFVWQGSTDANGIKEYELLIDGAVLITDIPPHDAETSQFIVSYEATADYYTLQVKNLIPDGSHTWKIIAIDTLENGRDSATWSFTIDTQAPSFVLSQIGTVTTSISAQDISTVTGYPIELTENSPQLLGVGEANSTVVLTVSIPGDPTQTFTQTTDVNGNWGQLLGILPRDTILTLDFIITDQAGLISILNNVQIIIKSRVITFPPPAETPSPSPIIIPGTTTPPSSPPPLRPGTKPARPILFTIPLTPAIEIAHEILQEASEKIPVPLKTIISQVPPEIRKEIVQKTARSTPVIVLVVTSPLMVLASLAITNRLGRKISLKLFWRGLQALHLFPILSSNPQGFVYDHETEKKVPYALVEVVDKDGHIVDQVLTDEDGFYRGLDLNEKEEYIFDTTHPDYQEEFDHSRPFPLIPIDILTQQHQKQVQIGPSLPSFNQINKAVFWPLFVFTGVLTIIFPSLWNWLALSTYPLQLIFKRSYKLHTKSQPE